MMNKPYNLLILLFVFFRAPLVGETPEGELVITLDEAWGRMNQYSLELESLRTARDQAIRQMVAPDQWIPSVSAGASLNRSSPLISGIISSGDSGREEADYWSVRGSLDMQLRIAPGLSISEELEVVNARIAELKLLEGESSLRYDLTVLYHEILAGERNISFQKENIHLAEERLNQTQEQFEKGLISDLELLSAQIAAARDLPGLQKEIADQEKRYITFSRYIGLDGSHSIVLSQEDDSLISLPSLNELIASQPFGPDIEILENQLRIAELTLELTEKGMNNPAFGMSFGWGTSVNPAFQRESWTNEEWSDSLGLGLSLSLPLDGHIKGSSDQLKLKALEEDLQLARLNLEAAKRLRIDEIRNLYLDLEMSRSNIAVDELNVSLLEQSLKKTELSYENGKSSLSDLEDSRQEWKEAVLTLEEERLNLKLLEIEIISLIH